MQDPRKKYHHNQQKQQYSQENIGKVTFQFKISSKEGVPLNLGDLILFLP